jgi:hypothetical protein
MMKSLKEIPKGFFSAAGAALFTLLMVGIRKAAKYLLGLELTEQQVSVIRVSMGLAGLAFVGAVGWIQFFRTRRKLQSALKKPVRFQDDCTFDTRLGLYRHRSKTGFFCGTCTPQGVESPLKEQENGWLCLIDGKHWHPNPDYKEPPPRRIPGVLCPEDM